MQIKSDFTEKEILKFDPLSPACHPISKLKAIAVLISGIEKLEFELDEIDFYGIHEIIIDATKEIEYLIDCSYKA